MKRRHGTAKLALKKLNIICKSLVNNSQFIDFDDLT